MDQPASNKQSMSNVDELLPFIPFGHGHVPLFCVVQWIATRGGAKIVAPDDRSTWKSAFDELLKDVVEGKVSVFGLGVPAGVRSTNDFTGGTRIKIDAWKFADCATVESPYEQRDFDTEMGHSDFLLRSFPYEDEIEWQKLGLSDEIVDRDGYIHWTKLTLLRSDVLEAWEFESEERYRPGKPGQPSSNQLILNELDARAGRQELEPSLGKEARGLAAWLKRIHPKAPQPKSRSIQDIIRSRYNELKSADPRS